MPETTTKASRLAIAQNYIDGQEVYDDDTRAALEGGQVSRYLLGTAEDAYRDNVNWTLHDTLDKLCEAASAEANEYPAWLPVHIVDLDTGDEGHYESKLTVSFD